ncbi:MAG: Cof-type HAD-IIB family hydrolase [Firmicutes bacterium]|nr:Cof-type HAD-IIB family hydrolase [Bacillota bacterium]
MKFDGYLFVSDMDETLLDSNHNISEENRAAIEYFIENGGRFTIATGRSVSAAGEHIEKFKTNAPAILYNGAKIYNFETGETLFEKFIDDSRKSALRIMHEKYPFLGFEVYSGEVAYVYSKCRYTARLKERNYPAVYEMRDEIWDRPWIKALMIGEKEVLDKYEPVYRQYDGGYAVRSGDRFFDIVADGISKGKTLKKLAETLGIAPEKVIAAGDNMNDIDMLETAALGFAVENAEPSAKSAANAIAPSCDNSAIAWIVRYIEKSQRAERARF